jgi:hypothetical protein
VTKYRITYLRRTPGQFRETEDVEADAYKDTGEWIDFVRDGAQVLRVKSRDVKRVEQVPD